MLRNSRMLVALGALVLAKPAVAQDAYDTEADASLGDDSSAEFGSVENDGSDNGAGESPEPDQDAQEAAPPTSQETDAAAEAEGEVSLSTAEVGTAVGAKAPIDETKSTSLSSKWAGWDFGVTGYFRAPMALGLSPRPDPQDPDGEKHMQVSYGPNRTVDANYFSFAYTRLQEQDWVELFVTAEREHVKATVGWMGYWLAAAGFRNPDAAWAPGIAYLTLDTDLDLGGIKPNIALSGGSWWPRFGYFEKYDTYTLGMYRQLGEQLKFTIPFTDDFTTTLVQGFGTGRDGSFNITAPPFYASQVSLNLIHYAHLQFNYGKWVEVGLHNNMQWTRDPLLLDGASGDKDYSNAREARLLTFGGEAKVSVPRAGSVWVSPSYVKIKNGWALGTAGVEMVHGLSPAGISTNYLGWSGSPSDSTGSGTLFNLGFLYENKLSNILGQEIGSVPEVTLNVFGLLVDATLDRPDGSLITQNKISQFKYGADIEYNPWKWLGVMARWDEVNYDMNNPGYIFSAITGRLSFYSNFMSGERIYVQYSRYRYGDKMVLSGNWPWGVPLVAGSDIIQGTRYAGSKPDMDVVKFQADIKF